MGEYSIYIIQAKSNKLKKVEYFCHHATTELDAHAEVRATLPVGDKIIGNFEWQIKTLKEIDLSETNWIEDKPFLITTSGW